MSRGRTGLRDVAPRTGLRGLSPRTGSRDLPPRTGLPVLAAVIALVVAACNGTAPSPSPTAAPSVSTTPAASPGPSSTATSTSEPSPTDASSGAPSAPTGACVVEPQSGVLPSDRFTSVVISSGTDGDLVTFVFGASSLPGPPAPPQGSLETATPPFTEAASGRPIDLLGQHAIQIRFTGMSIVNDAGEPVYAGPPEFQPGLPAVRDLALFDMSEGVVGWYLGYDGTGCVNLVRVGSSVTVRVAHH
jgi:hypothetical protein